MFAAEPIVVPLLSLAGLLGATLLTAVIGPVVVARLARRSEPSAAVAKLNDLSREEQRHRAMCLAAVQWLVTENGRLCRAAGVEEVSPPPLVEMLLAEMGDDG